MKTICMLLLLSITGIANAFSSNPTLTNIPDNTALDLGPYPCKGPVGDTTPCQGITDYSGFAYDSEMHKFLMFGGGHATTFRDDVDVFDFASLTWGHGDTSTPCNEMTQENQTIYGTWATTGHPHS